MKSTTEEIWKILDNSPCIKKVMNRGLINARALARYMIEEQKLDTTMDAVISAVRRYNPSGSIEPNVLKESSEILSQAAISTKSKLANVALIKDSEVQNLLPQLFSVIHYNRGDVLRIIQADESMKIIVDEKNLNKIEKLFPDKKIIKIDKNLAEINLHLHPEAANTPGLSSIITNELAINNVNIMEIMSCVPEVLLFVNEKDVLKAHQILYKLCHLVNETVKKRIK